MTILVSVTIWLIVTICVIVTIWIIEEFGIKSLNFTRRIRLFVYKLFSDFKNVSSIDGNFLLKIGIKLSWLSKWKEKMLPITKKHLVGVTILVVTIMSGGSMNHPLNIKLSKKKVPFLQSIQFFFLWFVVNESEYSRIVPRDSKCHFWDFSGDFATLFQRRPCSRRLTFHRFQAKRKSEIGRKINPHSYSITRILKVDFVFNIQLYRSKTCE